MTAGDPRGSDGAGDPRGARIRRRRSTRRATSSGEAVLVVLGARQQQADDASASTGDSRGRATGSWRIVSRYRSVNRSLRPVPARLAATAATDDGVNRSDSVHERLRRAGAGRVLKTRGETSSQIPLPHPPRSRAWLEAALFECARCHQVGERRSPVQVHCSECRAVLKRQRSHAAVRAKRARSG
jgi:hypothetical protein